jgi:hypothetical protein
MDKIAKQEGPETDAVDAAGVRLAQWMGRREAFGLMAGCCSAADIEALRRIRDSKMYLSQSPTWDEFCTHHLRVARRTVNREIAYLRQYGPAFFTIRQLTHITAADYPLIASHVSPQGVRLNGVVVPFDAENGAPLADAVEQLLQRAEREQPSGAIAAFDAILKRCSSVARSLEGHKEALKPDQKNDLASAVAELRRAAASLGAQVWDC